MLIRLLSAVPPPGLVLTLVLLAGVLAATWHRRTDVVGWSGAAAAVAAGLALIPVLRAWSHLALGCALLSVLLIAGMLLHRNESGARESAGSQESGGLRSLLLGAVVLLAALVPLWLTLWTDYTLLSWMAVYERSHLPMKPWAARLTYWPIAALPLSGLLGLMAVLKRPAVPPVPVARWLVPMAGVALFLAAILAIALAPYLSERALAVVRDDHDGSWTWANAEAHLRAAALGAVLTIALVKFSGLNTLRRYLEHSPELRRSFAGLAGLLSVEAAAFFALGVVELRVGLDREVLELSQLFSLTLATAALAALAVSGAQWCAQHPVGEVLPLAAVGGLAVLVLALASPLALVTRQDVARAGADRPEVAAALTSVDSVSVLAAQPDERVACNLAALRAAAGPGPWWNWNLARANARAVINARAVPTQGTCPAFVPGRLGSSAWVTPGR